jgi:hypothetical protein
MRLIAAMARSASNSKMREDLGTAGSTAMVVVELDSIVSFQLALMTRVIGLSSRPIRTAGDKACSQRKTAYLRFVVEFLAYRSGFLPVAQAKLDQNIATLLSGRIVGILTVVNFA